MIDELLRKDDFARRRRKLLNDMRPGSIAIVPGALEQRRNSDIYFPFRQDSDFWYLTGFCEPEALLVLVPDREQGECILFCRERDVVREQHDGPILGPEACRNTLGVDDAFPLADVDDILPGLLEARSQVYMNIGEQLTWDQRINAYLQELTVQHAGQPAQLVGITALGQLLHEHRLIKDTKERQLMAQAAQISVGAQYAALTEVAPGVTEAELEARLAYSFRTQGAQCEAYPSIVAAGENACVLHYSQSESVLLEDELVLIDAGCELHYYAADVTRTYPVSGRFSRAQRDLYDVVLRANVAAIDACIPSNHFNRPHEVATLLLVEGLVELGLLVGDPKDLMEQGVHTRFCPHKTSHWLGLDVHDVGDYRLGDTWRDLLPGMVLTVEPGIYIPRSNLTLDVPEEYRGIGIRIEDSVLIEESGPRVLTQGLIKHPDEIEIWMSRAEADIAEPAKVKTAGV